MRLDVIINVIVIVIVVVIVVVEAVVTCTDINTTNFGDGSSIRICIIHPHTHIMPTHLTVDGPLVASARSSTTHHNFKIQN